LLADLGLQGLLETARVVARTQAVLPEEFPFMALVYAWLPVLEATHVTLALAAAAAIGLLWWRGAIGRGYAAAVAAGSVAAAIHPYALPVPVLALAAFRLTERRRALAADPRLAAATHALARKLDRVGAGSAVRALLDVLLLGALVGLSVSLLEGVL